MTVKNLPTCLPGESEISLPHPTGEQVRGYFHDTGHGPVGIYLHGFRSDCNGEKALRIAQHAINQQRSWLRFDLRGHGQSDGELKNQVIGSGLSDLLLVIDSIADRPLILHGSSMGGWICLLATLRPHSRVKALMFIAPAFNYVQHNLASLPATVLKKWQADTYMQFPDAYEEKPYSLRYDIIEDAEPYDVMQANIELNIPVHIVHGEKDPIVPISYTREFIRNATCTNLTYETIPDGDHRLTDYIPLIISHIDKLWQETKT